MDSILNYNSGRFDVASEIGSLSDFGSIVGLDVASGDAEDYYILRLDLSCDRSIPADSEFVIWQFNTTLDNAVQIQISRAEYLTFNFYTTVNYGRFCHRKYGFSGGQVDYPPVPPGFGLWAPG
jgi:hypothetical protein